MLVQLTISNFAIINHLEIDFQKGLNIISGETGAGKSIIINAVNLILGGRASADLIRTGSDEARVEALFSIPENSPINEILNDMGFYVNGELLIKRFISRMGRNRITINGSMATLQMLSNLGSMLLSISGQHEHQTLLKPENHLFLLDDFGDLAVKRNEFLESFKRYESMKDRKQKIEMEIKEGRERRELNSYQIKEIEEADIVDDEDNILEEERKRLRHAEELKDLVTESYKMLYEREDSLLSGISICIKNMEKGGNIDKRFCSIEQTLESVRAELEEAGLELRAFQNSLTNDPFRLEEVEERLQVLGRLKRKYGLSLKDVSEFKEKLSVQINHLDYKEEDLEKLTRALEELEAELFSKAVDLSEKRRSVAKRFASSVESELSLLDMKQTRFQVRIESPDSRTDSNSPRRELVEKIRPDGFDDVEFMISPNMGEDVRPLAKIASGGELSRIMLALKTILAHKASVDTIIFDEVDSGIGGGTAEVVGEKLRYLSDYHQILCITHLPQIACQGETHFLVRKGVMNSRTQTHISRLNPEERVNEIARLLGGKVISEKAIDHAREMLTH